MPIYRHGLEQVPATTRAPVKKACGTTHGNTCLKAALTECAWAASRTKDTYLRAQEHSLVGRRGKKRAFIAVGHKILIMSYYLLKNKTPYKELGANYPDHRRKEKITKRDIKRLTNLGDEVVLKKAA